MTTEQQMLLNNAVIELDKAVAEVIACARAEAERRGLPAAEIEKALADIEDCAAAARTRCLVQMEAIVAKLHDGEPAVH